MKLVILGLDGLDPDLVERWDMSWFKQKAWSRHYVGLLRKLYTPIIWSCFLTGLNVEEHGYSLSELREKRSREAFRSKLLYILYPLRRKIPVRELGLRKLLTRLGLVNSYPPSIMPSYLLEKTFIEELRARGYSVIAVEVPGYNESKNEYYRTNMGRLVSVSFTEKAGLVEEAIRDVEERICETLGYIEEGYDLVFTYTPLPDIAFHMVVKPTLKNKLWLRTIHYRLYKIVKPLISTAVKRGYAVLIVSDHGFDLKEHYHSQYGFWSLSVSPPEWWSINTILDFKENIVRIVEDQRTWTPQP